MPIPALGQKVITAVPVGTSPDSVAVDSTRNKTYVSNYNSGTVTVIDGITLSTTNVNVGTLPLAVAVNPATNKIYASVNYDSAVVVIDGATLSTTSVSVFNPGVMAVDQATNKIYNVNHDVDSVTVIDGATLVATVIPVGSAPSGIALNPVTNKIYVPCYGSNAVTVIDGATLHTTSVSTSQGPTAVDVDQTTNKIYVSNLSGTVTVIDGATLATTTVTAGGWPEAIAVNSVTNKIYVANSTSNDVTVIDGATLATANVPAGYWPSSIAVDAARNKIYVVNNRGTSITVIDGPTNAYTNLAVGNEPGTIGIDSVLDRIFVANYTDGTVSVIDGTPPIGLRYFPVTPCRVVDTRQPDGDFGGPPIQGGTYRSFTIPDNLDCGIFPTAMAYSLNVTVVPQDRLRYLTVWPTGPALPGISTLNSPDGRTKATAAIVPAGNNAAISVYASDTTNVILDINGFFAPSGGAYEFYPLPPCRVADTRNPTGPLGGPYLSARQERDFPITQATQCNIPANAQVYSLNLTAIPRHASLGYLTAWPQGEPRPQVSTLNDPTGTIVANAALVTAGSDSGVAVYPTDDTDLVIDINGYFAQGPGGLALYTIAPCRALDTRQIDSGFNGLLRPPADMIDAPCGAWSTAQAYVLNATVLPSGRLGYLTLWPDGQAMPLVSTLNAIDGVTASNMAIVPSTDGSINAYAAGLTQLILDISSYFAP